MISVIARNARMGLAATMVLTAGFCGEAVAKHSGHVAPLEKNILTPSIHETTKSASMRYYGGPKSPMWSAQ